MPASPRETVLCHYHYDPLDRQARCTPYKEAGIQRFYCKTRLATEIQDAVQCSIFQHDDQLLAQQQSQSGKLDTTLLATDQQRSVLNALDATRPHPLAYTPYGHRPLSNGLLSLLGFNGERPDPVTGHYHLGNGYRQFNPVLMRFNSPDSWSPFGKGGLNAYAYCAGDPINLKDPTGHYLVKARFFDEVFVNIYKSMKGSRKEQFSVITQKTEELFGGADKVKILAGEKNIHPDAFIARVLSEKNKIPYFEKITPKEKPIEFLHKADSHLRKLLDDINTNHGLLHPQKPYRKHLNETEIRNLQAEQLTSIRELERVTSYLSTLRIEDTSRVSGDFNIEDWVKVASNIRNS